MNDSFDKEIGYLVGYPNYMLCKYAIQYLILGAFYHNWYIDIIDQ